METWKRLQNQKYRGLSGLRAWPVQVPRVLHSKVRPSHCPWWEAGARTFLGDHSDPDNSSCGTQMQVRLLKIIDAALFTKGVGPGLVLPARPSDSHKEGGGGVGCPSSVLVGKAKLASRGGGAPSCGPRGAPAQRQQGGQQVPALLSQEGTFSFGVPRKNCRTRSARSAKQKSRRRSWAMTSLNCGAGSAGEAGAHRQVQAESRDHVYRATHLHRDVHEPKLAVELR